VLDQRQCLVNRPKLIGKLSLRLSIAQSGHTHPDVEVLRNDIVMLPHIPDKQSLVALGKKVADQKLRTLEINSPTAQADVAAGKQKLDRAARKAAEHGRTPRRHRVLHAHRTRPCSGVTALASTDQ
jgi:hypothetical protein